MSLEDQSKILKDIEIENLSDNEMNEIDRLLEKAGIKIYVETKEIEDDNNYLVSKKDLRAIYEQIGIDKIYKEKEKLYRANINEKNDIGELNNTQKRVYLEVSTVISMMTNQMRMKINMQFLDFIERNKLNKKKCSINPNIKLEKQKIENEETKALLALIYRDYICSEKTRRELLIKEKLELKNKEENKEEYERQINS